ncbi:MAG: preprotein translocase subunit SecG, partial [Gammaproteobacteria bacterium]
LLFILQVIVAVVLIGIVLIQHGKGADTGAAFGSGASSTVFGSRGSGNFLTRTTTVLAIIFLANSMMLSYLSSEMVSNRGSLLDEEPASLIQPQGEQPPVAPVEGSTAPDVPTESTTATAPQDQPADVPAVPATEPPATDMPEVPKQ